MKQKLLTCTVPCYNSAEYMRKCIDSLLVGGEEMEIVIVNDGSADGTLKRLIPPSCASSTRKTAATARG